MLVIAHVPRSRQRVRNLRLFFDCAELGDYEGARSCQRECAKLCEELRRSQYRFYTTMLEAVLAIRRGDFAAADALEERARELFANPNDPVDSFALVGLAFMVLMLTVGILTPLLIPVHWLATHRLVDGTKLGVLGGVAVGFVALELVIFAYHRACHRFSFLWRGLHQMHHAPQRVDIPSSTVFHPFELVMQNVIAIGAMVFVLGLDPLAAALIGYLAAFYGLFQHWNVKTPRFLGYFIQRPEAHCLHHERNVHARNYADLPVIDMLFGTFENPETFEGEVGFVEKASFAKMLVGIDVNAGDDAGQPGAVAVALRPEPRAQKYPSIASSR